MRVLCILQHRDGRTPHFLHDHAGNADVVGVVFFVKQLQFPSFTRFLIPTPTTTPARAI